MAYATDRVILYSRTYEPMGDLAPDEVIFRVRHEVINLEHTLTLVTTRPLVEGTRLLTQDGTGKWREWVVSTPDDKHETGEHAIGTYVCIWSLQYDLMGCDDGAHAEPGMGSSCTGALAVAAALDGTDRWEVGSVDVAAVEAGKGCVMTIGKTAWERMSLVVDKWGGEVDAEIEVDSAGVVSRAVALRAHLGQTSVTRRFDWGHDLKSIRRTPEPGPRYCGIVPLGRGQTEYAEDDETTFEWPLTLTGDPEYYPEYTEDYILDPEASLAFRVPDGNGGWEYPKKTVTYDTDDVGELYELASADLYDQTHPKVTYEGDVLQFAAAGMEAQGVQLGDEVQTVDHGFAVDAPLRIQGRVVELEVNELSPRTDTHLVIGYVPETVASLLSSTISNAVTPLSRRISRIEGDTSIVHLQDLIDALNAEINATGGWWYAVPGMGTRTYDTAVTDPAVGTEASKVVEIRGGSIRIANSRTSGGDWDWKTLIVSGHIAAELVTAVNVTAGWIGNPSGTTFFDIDNDLLTIGGRTETQLLSDVDDAAKVATNYLSYNDSTGLDVGYSGTSAKSRINGTGMEVFDGSGVSEAVFNGSTVRVGRSDKAHVTITPDTGIELFDASNVSTFFAGDSDNYSIVRIGKASGSGNVVASSAGYVDIRNASTVMAHFGYGSGTSSGGGTAVAPYYSIGPRAANSTVGNYSVAEGCYNTASGYASHAEGEETVASSGKSHTEGWRTKADGSDCAHAEGSATRAYGYASHAEGSSTKAIGHFSHASGSVTVAGYENQFVCGRYNSNNSDDLFEVGSGSNISTANAFRVTTSNTAYVGSTQVTSDRRIKTDHGTLDPDDASAFIRSLVPHAYEKFGRMELGFFAQDVEQDPNYGHILVEQYADHGYEDFRGLSYDGIIAPLVAYAQNLERQVESLTERLCTLEGKVS